MAIALYIVVLSVTGSLLVYRNELNTLLATRKPAFDPNATRLTPQQIREAAQRAYPGWSIASVSDRITRRSPAYDVSLERGTGKVEKKDRYFSPYSGADLGDTFTRGERYLYWVVELHDNLLLEQRRKILERRRQHRRHSHMSYRSGGLVARHCAMETQPGVPMVFRMAPLQLGRP